jgi:hypothetical protein
MAKHNSEHPLSPEDWEEVMQKVTLLEEATLVPSLLPIIMKNRDALQLTEIQLKRLYAWRKTNYVNMVNIMNAIIEKKVQFGVESLSVNVDSSHLVEFQSEIHTLQQKLLKIRLSCRAIIIETFTEEQWENLAFIVSDNPRIASLLSQSYEISVNHRH